MEREEKKLVRKHEFLTRVGAFRCSRVCAGAPLTSVETPMWARHQKQPISPRDGTESRLQTRLLQQTPMTVYYRQFQTSYARGLNIANGDNRQVPQLPWWKVCVSEVGRLVCNCATASTVNVTVCVPARVCVLSSQRDNWGPKALKQSCDERMGCVRKEKPNMVSSSAALQTHILN